MSLTANIIQSRKMNTKKAFTWDKFEIPSKKQIESSMFDLPLPFKPVMALNWGSNPETVVLCA